MRCDEDNDIYLEDFDPADLYDCEELDMVKVDQVRKQHGCIPAEPAKALKVPSSGFCNEPDHKN